MSLKRYVSVLVVDCLYDEGDHLSPMSLREEFNIKKILHTGDTESLDVSTGNRVFREGTDIAA